MKQIELEYPKASSALYFDGKVHLVVPISLLELTNGLQNFFLMEYIELNSGVERKTLLESTNEGFVNVPLVVYDHVFDELYNKFKTTGKQLDLSLIQDHVKTKKPITIMEYFENTKQAFLVDIFFNEVDQKIYSDPECTREIFYNPSNSLCYYEREAINPVIGNLDLNTLQRETVINYNVVAVHKEIAPPIALAQTNPEPVKYDIKETKSIYYNKLDFKYYENPECTIEIPGAPESLGEIVGNNIMSPNGIMYDIIEVRVSK